MKTAHKINKEGQKTKQTKINLKAHTQTTNRPIKNKNKNKN